MHFSVEIEGMVTIKLSDEISRTESRNLGALSKFEEILINSQLWRVSGTESARRWNIDVKDGEPTGYRYQIDPLSEVEFSACRTSTSDDSEPD